MTIQKIIAKSRVTEVDATMKIIIAAYEKGDWSSDNYLTAMFNELKPHSQKLSLAINSTEAESELDHTDELRDERIRAIFHTVAGYLYNPLAEIKSAAEVVEVILDKYGLSMSRESYAVESSLIESMLTDLSDPTVAAAVEKLLGLGQLISELTTIQADFEEKRLSFETEKATQNQIASATEIKKEVVAQCNNKIVLYLNAMNMVNTPMYGELTQAVSQIIADNNSAVKRRTAN